MSNDVRRRPPRSAPHQPGEAAAPPRDVGMTLVEVIVAFGLFAIFATAALVVLNSSLNLSRDDSARLSAANLASRELEITREVFASPQRGPDFVQLNAVANPSPLPGGTTGDPLLVNNVPFTVTRTAQWSSVDGAASTCDDGTSAELAYLRVKVDVTWPTLGTRPPVTMYTTMTPAKGTYSNLNGHIGLKVVDSLGRPRPGVTVSASGPMSRSGTTGSDGCVLLAFLTPGSYQISLSGAGFVTPEGSASASTTVVVQSGVLLRKSVDYDRAATIEVQFDPYTNHKNPVVNTIPVMVSNSGLQPSGKRLFAAPAGGADKWDISGLWPYPSGYQVWAGACPDNDPEYSGPKSELDPTLATPGPRKGAVETTAGGVKKIKVDLAPITVVGLPGTPVVARQEAGKNGCTDGARIELGTIDSNGLRTSLPYGSWVLSSSQAAGTASPVTGVRVRLDAPQRDSNDDVIVGPAPVVTVL